MKKCMTLKAIAQKEGYETVEELNEAMQKSVDGLTSLRKQKQTFKADAKTKLRELDEQFDFIEKQMGGTWRIENAPYKGGVTGTSTFAGYDTLGSGFSSELGFRFTHHVEFDDNTVRMLSDKTKETIPKRNVRDTDEIIKEVQKGSRDDPNHLFHASPECQRCSRANTGELLLSDNDYLNATAVVKILKKGNAPVVTIENVPDYMTFVYKGKHLKRKKPYSPFDEIIKTLEKQDYAVDFHVVDAADFGGASSRKRLFIRAVKKNTLSKQNQGIKLNRSTGVSGLTHQHPIAEKVAKQTGWLEAVKDLLPSRWKLLGKEKLLARGIVDDTAWLKTESDELSRIRADIAEPGRSLNADSEIITAGGSQSGTSNARNANRPGPVVTKADQVSRIIFPGKGGSLDPADGARAIRTTPRMLARLMGLPDDMPLPKATKGKAGSKEALVNATVNAKNAIGNGIHGNATKAVIESLLKGRIAGSEGVAPIAAKANRRQTFKHASAEARHKAGLLATRFRLRDAQDKTATRVRELRGNADKLRQGIKDDKALREAAYERAENAIPKIENIKGDPLEIKDQVASLGRGEGQHKLPKLGENIKGDLVKSLTKTLQEKEGMLDALSKNLDESEAAMSLLTPQSRALVEHLDQEVGELLARRVASGATEQATKLTARLQSVTKNYSERVLTGEAREWLLARRATDGKGGTMLDMFHRHMGRFSKSKMSAKTGGDIPRLDQYREEFTSAVNGFFEKLPGNRPAQWFDKDFSVTYPGKYIGDERSVLNATFVKGLGDDIVENIDLNDLNDVASKVSLAEFYIEHGIHRIKHNGKIVVIGDSKGLQKGMREAGLFKRGIRHEIADEIRGITTKLVDSDDMSHLGEIYDKMVLGPLRWSLTRPWLPFHLRNFTTNIFLNWLGGVSNPKYYKQAFKVVWNKDQAEELGRLHDLGVVTGGWAKEAAKELTEGGRIKVWSNLEKWFKEKYPKGSEGWKKYTSFTEDMGRAAHYYGKKADGLTDFEAVESVNKYLLDYSDLTNFERRYGKRMFMFYNWTRKMIPMLTKEFISNPHKMAALMRGSVQPSLLRPEGLPEYIKASFALPLPWKDKQGREQFITTFGSPIEEFRKFDISQHEGGLVGRGTELARTIIGQMTPPFKQAAEIAAGKDFFYRKPIQEADRVKQMFGLEKLLPGLRTDVLKSGKTRLRADPDMLYALRQSPASRLISTLQKLGDPDRNLADKLFATLSGINVARFYKETQAPRVKVEQLMALLKRKIPEGQARKFETVYLTEAGKKNRDSTMLMDALRAAEKKSRAVYQHSGGKL
jgi:site-specific DNA-cytosine methylase